MPISLPRFSSITLLAGFCMLVASGCMRTTTKGLETSIQKPIAPKEEKMVVFGPVYFDNGKSVLTPKGLDCLYSAGLFLTNNPGYRLTIEGNADERDDPFYDKYLSEERAKSVYDWLVLYGAYQINAQRVEMKSFGNTRPAQANCGNDEACHSKNRRVDLISEMP